MIKDGVALGSYSEVHWESLQKYCVRTAFFFFWKV